MDAFSALQAQLQRMARELSNRSKWVVVTNHDADGLSAGAIIITALQRAGHQPMVRVLKQLYRESLTDLVPLGENFFFVDFGSGQLDFLTEELGERFFVLDHHQPLQIEYAWHCNPFLFGFDGGHEVSASGMAFWFAMALDPANQDLAALAVVGATGDMQDGDGKLVGLNARITEHGQTAGVLSKKNDLRLYGRISRPLVQFLAFSSAPVLPGLTANEPNCIRFLQELGIDLKQGEEWTTYETLSLEEKKRLVSALILLLHEHGFSEKKIQGLVGEVYSLSRENPRSPLFDAKEFGTLLNACGRWSKSEIGLAVCLGDRNEQYAKALSLLAQHRKQLHEGIEWVRQTGVHEKKSFYFFDAEEKIEDGIVGIVAGMLYGSGQIGFDKPIIALARYPNGDIKASGRATRELVENGLNLGHAFKEVCAILGTGNEGGGHKIAAGAKVLPEHKDRFLELVNNRIAEQLARVKPA